jgi:hypothetical protein
MNLDESEAKIMATAFARVARHYPIIEAIGDKGIDHINLISVMGGIYGTRLMAWRLRKATENEPSNVTPIRPHGPAA